jgi:pilus assembly protein CpaB
MSKMRIVLFILAGIAALAAGLMARNFASQRPDKEVVVENTVKKSDVLVAAKDLGLGEKLSEGAFVWKSWPTESLMDGMITKEAQPDAIEKFAQGRARLPIYIGETVMEKKIIHAGDKGFLASILPKGMRAISVAISERSSAGGFILPNDRVDVILTRKNNSEGGQQLVSSETVLTNVRVLAVNQNYGKQEEGTDTIAVPEGKTATLELSARQVEVVAQVESMGELSLALRSIAENDGVELEQIQPVLAEKYSGTPKAGTTDTLFVRYGRETYANNR